MNDKESDISKVAAKSTIYVTMLGDFTLRSDTMPENSAVSASLSGRSRRLWMLLAYLIVNRDRGVSTTELIDLLWPEVDVPNPQTTLQNNVSRIRKMLGDAGFSNSKSLVVCEGGLYRWAPNMHTELDADHFETIARRYASEAAPGQAEEALAACMLYKGEFLAQAQHESWCVNLGIYYRSLFTTLCRKTLSVLMDAGSMPQVEQLCMHAIEADPSAEEFSVLLMRALTEGGNPKKALDHYERIKRIFEEDYGAVVSGEMEFEREAALKALYGQGASAEMIRRFLNEPDDGGAFLCSNTVFREIVQLRRHEMARSKAPAHLASVSLMTPEDDHMSKARNAKRLENVLTNTLRSGDPFTKVGLDQFLVLLPGATRENSEVVFERIAHRFRKEYPQVKVKFRVAIFDLVAI